MTDHKGVNDDSPQYRDVTLTVTEHIPGTPGTTTPGTTTPGTTTPGTTTPGTTTPGSGIPGEDWTMPVGPYAPGTGDPNSAPTVGWDSTMAVGGKLGVGGGVGGYAGVSNSYSFMLWADNFSPITMGFVRAALGMYKIGMDVTTMDFPGLMRDVVGVIGPAVGAIADELSDNVTDYKPPV